eukprot:4642407-Amphidinium_carterae.1
MVLKDRALQTVSSLDVLPWQHTFCGNLCLLPSSGVWGGHWELAMAARSALACHGNRATFERTRESGTVDGSPSLWTACAEYHDGSNARDL